MKRFFLLVVITVMLLSLTGCGVGVTDHQMEKTLSQFTEALKEYDRDAMAALLTEFPDNSAYVYLDDIFNDDAYIKLYQTLFSEITYEIKSCEKNQIVAEYSMPNIQELYSTVTALILQMALSDENLSQKLAEDDQNGIILIQETMLSFAEESHYVETMEQEFTLTFTEVGGKTVIECNDELRALITGNFFLSKSTTLDEVNNADE